MNGNMTKLDRMGFGSPYIFGCSNPVKFGDPTGRDAVITISGHTVTVQAVVILTGQYSNDQVANIYKDKFDEVWGSVKRVSVTMGDTSEEYDVEWDVTVRVMEDGEKEGCNGVNNCHFFWTIRLPMNCR